MCYLPEAFIRPRTAGTHPVDRQQPAVAPGQGQQHAESAAWLALAGPADDVRGVPAHLSLHAEAAQGPDHGHGSLSVGRLQACEHHAGAGQPRGPKGRAGRLPGRARRNAAGCPRRVRLKVVQAPPVRRGPAGALGGGPRGLQCCCSRTQSEHNTVGC